SPTFLARGTKNLLGNSFSLELLSRRYRFVREWIEEYRSLLSNGGGYAKISLVVENPDYKYFWPQFRAIPDSSLISSNVLKNFAQTYMNALKKSLKKMIKPLVENVRRALGRQDENAERAWETLFQTIAIIIEHCKKSLT
ncbi:hypothetical protein LOAG_11169, partial [Loa loa]